MINKMESWTLKSQRPRGLVNCSDNQSTSASALQFGGIPDDHCQYSFCSSWVNEPSCYWNSEGKSQCSQWSHQEKDKVVAGGSYLGIAPAPPRRPQGQTWPQRRKIWPDTPGICDLTWAHVCESVRGQGRGFEGTAMSSRVFGLYQRDLASRAPRVADQHGALWRCSALNGCWIGIIDPLMSVLLFNVGGGKPTHLKSRRTGYITTAFNPEPLSHTNIKLNPSAIKPPREPHFDIWFTINSIFQRTVVPCTTNLIGSMTVVVVRTCCFHIELNWI